MSFFFFFRWFCISFFHFFLAFFCFTLPFLFFLSFIYLYLFVNPSLSICLIHLYYLTIYVYLCMSSSFFQYFFFFHSFCLPSLLSFPPHFHPSFLFLSITEFIYKNKNNTYIKSRGGFSRT